MPKLYDILDWYYEHQIDQDSNNGNDAWVNRRDNWVDDIISDFLDEEGYQYLGAKGGKSKSTLKAKSSRENGKLGGRPKKIK